jgi:hypothetical protein
MTQPQAEPRTTPEGSPSPTPPPTSSRVRAPMFGVRTTPSTSTESAPPAGPGSVSGSGPADPLDDRESGPTRSVSDGPTEPLKLDKRPLADVLKGAVLGGGEVAHKFLARTAVEVEEGLWLVDGEREAASIAKPAASLLERRVGGAGAVVSPDVNDLLALLAALGGYLVRNAVRTVQLRRAFRRVPTGFITDPDNTDQQGEQA